MMNIIFQLIKTVGKSTRVRSWPQTLTALQVNRFGHRAHQQAPLELSLGNYPRVWWEKHYWADFERALWAVGAPSSFLTLALVSLWAVMPWRLAPCDLGDPSWRDPWFPHGACVTSLTFWYDLVILMFFSLFLLPYHVEMIQCYHSCINQPMNWHLSRLCLAVLFWVAVFCFVLVGLFLVFVFGLLWLRDGLLDYCRETSAWPGTCANFNPTNLAPPKHHARLRCASFGWHVLQRKSYPHGQAMPQKHWSKNAKVLGQKKLCWKCWGKKSLCWTRKSHIGTLLPRDVSLHDCRHIEIDA